ncbi:MAG: HD domain-containing protein, partial [Deltaproteobacteria bacterium]|nr:HD domain-containing protein [Deltaproteobacteria bacterium]
MISENTVLTIDLHDLVLALSEALGLVGGKIVNHGKRVAWLALNLAEDLQLSPTEFDELRTAALLHDAGVSRTKIHEKLRQMDWEGAMEHCQHGATLLKSFPPLTRAAQIILYHHTKWPDLARMDIDPRIALLANLIFLADRIDVQINWDIELLLNRDRIVAQIESVAESFFHPELLKSFHRKAMVEIFWLSLHPRHLPTALSGFKPLSALSLDLDGLQKLAHVLATIVDNKSSFTRYHSEGVSRLCEFFAQRLGMPDPTIKKLGIAGLLHDVGKLAIPDEILDKPSALTDDEFQIVKCHPFETYYILSGLPALKDSRDWASYHHEKADGSGYAFRYRAKAYRLEHLL